MFKKTKYNGEPAYVYYNANPKGKRTDDCVVRAIAEAEGRSWEGSSGKDLILMPGTAFDRERRRLGYGGGFYDQFLQNACSAVKIAVCFNCQVLPELPEEETDVRPDRILTEEGWI